VDGITLAQWLAQNVKEKNIREFLVGDMSYACQPEQISVLSFLSLVRACVSFDKLNGFTDAAQQDRLVGGVQPVAIGMAEQPGADTVRPKARCDACAGVTPKRRSVPTPSTCRLVT
jgi:hypothetical protein